jgi:prepilin-type N-terminal cleavage/methylation domain-containing protein
VSRPALRARGFTLIEMMTVVGIIAIVATMAALSLSRARPRANLAGVTVDLQALIHSARQQALVSGNDVVVLFFPGYSPESDVVGRVVVYEDGDHDFFDDAAAVNFAGDKLGAGAKSEIVTSLDLPAPVRFGPAAGMGGTAKLAVPLANIPVNADCTFCDGAGADRRGALVFDSRGRARFYAKNGAPLAVEGGSVSLEVPALGAGGKNQVRTLAVVGSTGAVRAFNNG